MLRRIHPVAGVLAFLIILSFWTSTVAVEIFGSPAAIATVKQAIPWGFLVLVPSLAVVGASGFRMAGASSAPLVLRKKRRMPFIAANGLLILIPAALTSRRSRRMVSSIAASLRCRPWNSSPARSISP